MSYYEDDYQPSFVDRLRFFLKIFGITLLVAGAGIFLFFSKGHVSKVMPAIPTSMVKLPEDFSVAAVLGTRTKKAEEISKAVSSDIGGGVEEAKKQVLNIKLGDIINVVSRAQKIPQDAHKVGDYVKDQISNIKLQK
jgi:hypothetical protein